MLLTLLQSAITPPPTPIGPFGPIGQDVMNSGGNWKDRQPERWQDHVPSWVWREQEKDRKRSQQRRNAAILALSL